MTPSDAQFKQTFDDLVPPPCTKAMYDIFRSRDYTQAASMVVDLSFLVTAEPSQMSRPTKAMLTEVLTQALTRLRSIKPWERDLRRDAARQALRIHAPLASQLGMECLRRDLEDLAFSFLHPEVYYALRRHTAGSVAGQESSVEQVKNMLAEYLREHGIDEFRILGRVKHLFSIHRKLLVQGISLEKVYDRIAFRIILQSVPQCYKAIAIIHKTWEPVSGRFKDFIRIPKSNGYQSIHTTVTGPFGEYMEIQVRTEKMDLIATEGTAAHWAYKGNMN